MKKYIATLVSLVALIGCGDMNELHQVYLDRGETIYTGAVDSLEVCGGLNRVKLKWEMNADPRIDELVIRWNNKKDSVVLEVDRSVPEKVGIYKDSLILDENLSEGSILFQLYTSDNQGHTSVVREVTGEVYGESFAASAALKLPRKIETVQTVSTTSVKLIFAEVDQPTMLTTKVYYTNLTGEDKVIEVSNEETELLLEGITLGNEIRYQSTFLPEQNALDAFPGKLYSYTLPDMVLPNVGDTWETLENSWYSYGGDPVSFVGAGRFLEKATGDAAIDDGENCYSTNLALEPKTNWRIGLKINKDYSIKVYMAKLNPDWVNNFRYCNYTPEKCYFDPETGTIHFDYEVFVEGAWTIKGEIHMKFVSSEAE